MLKWQAGLYAQTVDVKVLMPTYVAFNIIRSIIFVAAFYALCIGKESGGAQYIKVCLFYVLPVDYIQLQRNACIKTQSSNNSTCT